MANCVLPEKAITPVEDLMQEHGLLNRVLLIYEEFIRRLLANIQIDPILVTQSATIIRKFVEDYHEKNEEKYVFPVVQKCPQFKQLIKTLLDQHQIGRIYTDKILQISKKGIPKSQTKNLCNYLAAFVHMYRAHESREDTVVFRAFHSLTSDIIYKELGEKFESSEQQIFGKDDYDVILAQVENIEKALNIYDLAHYS